MDFSYFNHINKCKVRVIQYLVFAWQLSYFLGIFTSLTHKPNFFYKSKRRISLWLEWSYMLPWWTQQNPNRWGCPKQKRYDEVGLCVQNRLTIVNLIINTKLEGCMWWFTHNRNLHFDLIWFVSIQIQFWSLKRKYAWSAIVDRMMQFFIQSKCNLNCPVGLEVATTWLSTISKLQIDMSTKCLMNMLSPLWRPWHEKIMDQNIEHM